MLSTWSLSLETVDQFDTPKTAWQKLNSIKISYNKLATLLTSYSICCLAYMIPHCLAILSLRYRPSMPALPQPVKTFRCKYIIKIELDYNEQKVKCAACCHLKVTFIGTRWHRSTQALRTLSTVICAVRRLTSCIACHSRWQLSTTLSHRASLPLCSLRTRTRLVDWGTVPVADQRSSFWLSSTSLDYQHRKQMKWYWLVVSRSDPMAVNVTSHQRVLGNCLTIGTFIVLSSLPTVPASTKLIILSVHSNTQRQQQAVAST